MLQKKNFRNIFIIESRNWFSEITEKYNAELDLVLTFDFGLKLQIEKQGGIVLYVDHLCDQAEMQKNNYLAAEFFKNWHYDSEGKDIFTEKGIPFGFAFRIEFWSEFLFFIRLRACLEKIRNFKYNTIIVGSSSRIIEEVMSEMNLTFLKLQVSNNFYPKYFFDIHRYMYDALHGRNLKKILYIILLKLLSYLAYYVDILFRNINKKRVIFVQVYHPTKRIIEELQKNPSLKVITNTLSGKGIKRYLYQRLIPIRGRLSSYKRKSEILLSNFRRQRCRKLILCDGTDVTEGAYRTIEKQISPRILEALRFLNSAQLYLDKERIDLQIMIANLGLIENIIYCILKVKKVPSYMIINGFLTESFVDDAKYADFINGYSESIKANYFIGMNNVFCFGDPRMDDIFSYKREGNINRVIPTVWYFWV